RTHEACAHKLEEYKVVTTGTDGEETSVVIVHGNSPRSIISEGGSTQTKYRSISPRIRSKNSIRSSQQIHPGSSRLCLKVHGSHSKLSDLLPPPISPRSAPATSLHHQSAWYNVPGRYIRPGEVLPAKRSQKRPLSTGRSSLYEQHGTSARSSPTHRSSHI
uniref:Uncharacterized protein n=1 Tax=Ciona savignyi TaxID=51511 RepID=H2Y800_CIOSA